MDGTGREFSVQHFGGKKKTHTKKSLVDKKDRYTLMKEREM
jgi:hypothetical protein